MNFIRARSVSLSLVVLVLLITMLMQGSISYGTFFGLLVRFIPSMQYNPIITAWLALRVLVMVLIIILWVLNRKLLLFKMIIVFNGLLTIGLLVNLTALGSILLGITAEAIDTLLVGVLFMVIANILIFSVWYWIIDPPGVVESPNHEQPWDFLFPQRAQSIPHYEAWQPRYTDYLYLAFTDSFAFSPTDTLPLTRRAKLLMLLQSVISIVTITAIAGGAINILAGNR